MFPYPIATPQKCNIQTFYGTGPNSQGDQTYMSWNKPVGVSHVYMMLIGGGGSGDGTSGGGSGAVTVWYGAAQHVPNNLVVRPAVDSDSSVIQYRNTSGSPSGALRQLLIALGGSGVTAGAASTAGAFAASGFYKSTAGQDGSSGGQSASSTTFLSGGGSSGSAILANYGYALSGTPLNGLFQMQPIIVGLGSKGSAKGAIGCGGGNNNLVAGGPGMVLIASW